MFFLPYMIGFYHLIANTRLFYPATVNILGINNRVIITNYNEFNTAIAKLGTLTSAD